MRVFIWPGFKKGGNIDSTRLPEKYRTPLDKVLLQLMCVYVVAGFIFSGSLFNSFLGYLKNNYLNNLKCFLQSVCNSNIV